MDEYRAHLQSLLDNWVDENADTLKQGTAEWKLARRDSFGGSNAAKLLGIVTFYTKERSHPHRDCVIDKLGLSTFPDNIPTRWGNIFESIIEMYVANDLNTEIVGSEYFLPGKLDWQTYSPDGVGIVEVDSKLIHNRHLDGAFSTPHSDKHPAIVLFEFKCPYSRKLNGQIPQQYLPQVKSGLDTIDICQLGMYIEAVFRRCKWRHLDNTSRFDTTKLHYNTRNTPPPIAGGFFSFELNTLAMGNDADTVAKNITRFMALRESLARQGVGVVTAENATVESLSQVCVGDVDKATVQELFLMSVDCGILTRYYSDIIYFNREDDNTTRDDLLVNYIDHITRTNAVVIGIFPWKLFQIDYMTVDKTPGYLEENIRPVIDDLKVFIKKCREMDSPEEQMKAINARWAVEQPAAPNVINTGDVVHSDNDIAEMLRRIEASKGR